jgi:RNA polymerase sigma factor for flagellar operon FliA
MAVVAEAVEPWLVRRAEQESLLEQTVNDSLAGVRFLAARLATRLPAHVDVDDLVQVGLIGLLQSAQRYDSERGVKFQTYANRRVQGAMLDYLRSLDWRPRSVRRRNRTLAEATAAVEQRTGAAASEEEVAAEIGLSSPEFAEWMRDYASRGEQTVISHNEQDGEEHSENLLAWIADPADSPETVVEKQQLKGCVARAIEGLPHNERTVLSLYYYEQRTMKEIGRILGVKQARVSQLHSQGLRRLRLRLRKGKRSAQTAVSPVAAPANGCAA